MTFNPETVVGVESFFTGRMAGEDLTVLGRFEGDVQLKGTLRVGPQGSVKANVQAAAVEVKGEFEGEIRTSNLVFGETARAKGTFKADKLTIKDGALVDGSINLHAGGPTATLAPGATAAPAAKKA